MIYDEGLNSDFCRFMSGKVKLNLHINRAYLSSMGLCEDVLYNNLIKTLPLFNFDKCESSNPNDHTENKKVLILEYDTGKYLTFYSDVPLTEYSEMVTETIIDDLKYTLYYTYDAVTGEPAPFKLTSNGNTTDKYGYFLDCEVIT